MKVEFILALDNGTWITEVIEIPSWVTTFCPGDSRWNADVERYAELELGRYSMYENVAYWGIYNSDPEVDKDDSDS